jgi:SAM-dependent methyltransferase
MGILKEPADFVRALRLPVAFAVCELGDQMMSGGKTPTPAVAFYRSLGCEKYISVDGNGNGSMTADLNLPLSDIGQFDLVTDFGTGEHIFDQAQVWRTIHSLCKPGGFIVFDRPTQGYAEHCFYLVTVGLLEDIAEANRYTVHRLQTSSTPRGVLVRGVFQMPVKRQAFRIPQQGRYQDSLRLPKGAA